MYLRVCALALARAPYSDKSDANIAKRMLKLSRAELAKAISIITGFNRLSYMQFKADPAIDPTCRLCGEGNETFWHLVTECPRLNSTRQKFFLDNTPKKDEWKISKLISFSRYPIIQNMLSHEQEYNAQPIYEIDHLFSDDSDSSNSELRYRTYLKGGGVLSRKLFFQNYPLYHFSTKNSTFSPENMYEKNNKKIQKIIFPNLPPLSSQHKKLHFSPENMYQKKFLKITCPKSSTFSPENMYQKKFLKIIFPKLPPQSSQHKKVALFLPKTCIKKHSRFFFQNYPLYHLSTKK